MLLPDDEIEVIAIKNGKYWKSIMTIRDWKKFKKKAGYKYLAYEIGFSQYKTEN
jgi:hypothetical protein